MATYVFTGTITIDGSRIRSRKDAITELQIMIDDYANNNPVTAADISIHWDKVEKVKPESNQ